MSICSPAETPQDVAGKGLAEKLRPPLTEILASSASDINPAVAFAVGVRGRSCPRRPFQPDPSGTRACVKWVAEGPTPPATPPCSNSDYSKDPPAAFTRAKGAGSGETNRSSSNAQGTDWSPRCVTVNTNRCPKPARTSWRPLSWRSLTQIRGLHLGTGWRSTSSRAASVAVAFS